MEIVGEIAFGGSFAPTGGTGLGDATGLTFDNPAMVVDGSDDFAGLVGDDVTFSDIQLDGSTLPIDPLWTVGAFEFDLLTMSVDFHTNTFLLLSGTGEITAPGFAVTEGTFALSAGSLTGAAFSFQANSAATPMPEPGAMALFGIGFVVVHFAHRRPTR